MIRIPSPTLMLPLCAALWVAVLTSGCSKDSAGSVADPHAGHDHGHGGEEGGMCPEHDVPGSECGICQPQMLPTLKPGQGAKVRLPAADSAAIAGVETAPAKIGPMADGNDCYADLAFNQNKLARISTPVEGILEAVESDLGAKVAENQVVARVWSATVAEAVSKAVLSHQWLDRERRLRAGQITAQKDLEQAEADHRAACEPLRLFGFTEAQVDEWATKPRERILVEVRAPFGGEIVERDAVRGARVESGQALFTIADRATLWAMLSIPEQAVAGIKAGLQVELRLDAFPDRVFPGRLTWIDAKVDERTRMARARAEVADPEGCLKAGMFAKARILNRTNPKALLVPEAALQKVEGRDIVFVKLAGDLFEARCVLPGSRREGWAEIVEGLRPDEAVIVERAFPVKSALLISRLGAGCADD